MVAGRLLLRLVVFFSVIVSVICIGNATVFAIYNGESTKGSVYWLFFALFFVIGLLLAWLSTRYKKFGYFSVSLWLGFELGVTLANLVYFEAPSIIFFWIIITIAMVTIATLSAMNFNYHMIWVTAMIGPYITLTCLSAFLGAWPLSLNLPTLYDKGAET